jgi:hypothetical protein
MGDEAKLVKYLIVRYHPPCVVEHTVWRVTFLFGTSAAGQFHCIPFPSGANHVVAQSTNQLPKMADFTATVAMLKDPIYHDNVQISTRDSPTKMNLSKALCAAVELLEP